MPIPSICWLAVLIVLLVLEAATVGLVSLWFTMGSLCALLTFFFVGNIWVRFVIFLTVSSLCLVIIHLLAKKCADSRRMGTNVGRVIGAEGVVAQAIDSLKAQGQITVNDASWTARTEEGCPAIPTGSRVRVLRIEGVKVIMSPLPVPTPER